ncbi:glutathione S-transferase [Pseudoalteromonas sp. SG43-7]|uniref:glutathione S-transferase family protein n=1 Tax=unclassified Pseudoalteromonas TaxID=194690 RepID=UPI0015FF6ADB|nr:MULTISPECIES: glutathione S-transferase [unclassified Pseudoalteromonas]MBB1334322.1 glutathione S-transferase [Pseudoalteromonas sp. SR41-6]MBB1342070.1 glutathione S-transferase [Pseudoalteromonas sp. SR45-6]MBB1424395.1 glutathione S-transferase [Pseudoalteromonas sp. SG43-7]MBB1459881.1 glutathione S-transferase [Pseudoalteromonas sp. SG41-8]
MIKLHHLNKSRSKRIIWLLEELDVDYEIVAYQRNSETFLAPDELKAIHPLGKSPVIEDNGQIIAESGAITDYLISKYGNGKFAPSRDSKDYIDYQQWLHFAESSAILPLLLKMFVQKDGAKTQFLEGYADAETAKVISYFNDRLEGKRYLVGDSLTGADFMMSFIVEIVKNAGQLAHFKNLVKYDEQLQTHEKFHSANELEAKYD